MNEMMEYKGYRATFSYDNEDEIFVGKVHGLSDSLNFHGTSVAELKEMFHQSIDNYLEFCERVGKNPDKEYSGTFNVRIPSELHRKTAELALQNGETINAVMKNALEEYIKNDTVKQIYFVLPCPPITPPKPMYNSEQYNIGRTFLTREVESICLQ